MRSKSKLFELLALKEKVARNKFFKQSKSLISEIDKNNNMAAQLKEITANKKVSAKEITASQLRSDKWYDFQIQEQINATENRVKFLEEESQQISKKIAVRNQRMLKSIEKATLQRKIETENLEKKALLSSPPSINKRQDFES
ncbi:MAG: hypothetical protein CML37_01690 [Rhodobacteraceae bacterium]|nr:hypothetical protein [Paracoccaceae bacterium]